jgi:hypothetical protein
MADNKLTLADERQRLILRGATAPVILYGASIFVMLGSLGKDSWAVPGVVMWYAAQLGNLAVIIWGLLRRQIIDQQPIGFRRGFYILYALNILILLSYWTFIFGFRSNLDSPSG